MVVGVLSCLAWPVCLYVIIEIFRLLPNILTHPMQPHCPCGVLYRNVVISLLSWSRSLYLKFKASHKLTLCFFWWSCSWWCQFLTTSSFEIKKVQFDSKFLWSTRYKLPNFRSDNKWEKPKSRDQTAIWSRYQKQIHTKNRSHRNLMRNHSRYKNKNSKISKFQ